MTRHFTPDERRAAVLRMKAGEKPVRIARELGISTAALRKWRSEITRAALPPVPSASSSGTSSRPMIPNSSSTPTEPSAAPSPSGQADPTEHGKATEAERAESERLIRAAMDAGGPPPGGGEQAAPQSPLGPTMAEKAAGLVATCELTQFLTLGIMARASGAQLSEEQFRQLATYTPLERQMLLTLAPAAVPYVDHILSAYPWIPACLFGLGAGLALGGRLKQLKQLTPEKPKKAPAPRAAASDASASAAA